MSHQRDEADDPPRMMPTVSIIYDGTPEQQARIARMRGYGAHVTVWNAPPGYRLPDPVSE